MKNAFLNKCIGNLYAYLKKSGLSVLLFPTQVRKDLQVLKKDEKKYYIKKITRFLGILCSAIFIVIVVVIDSRHIDTTIHCIERPESFEKAKEVYLQVGGEQTYALEIHPTQLTELQAEEQFYALVTFLEKYMLGENLDVMQITGNLVLPQSVEEYPFDIYWESDKAHIIDDVGNVYRENIKEDELVTLTAICAYMEHQWEQEFVVQVKKEDVSKEILYERNLKTYLLEEEERTRTSKVWNLPTSFQKEALTYSVAEGSQKEVLFVILLLVSGVALWIGSDKDLHNNRKKMQEKLEEEYLNFVSGFSLYISAGLNLQAAMKACVKDYKRREPEGDMLRELLLDFEKDMLNGYSFQSAWERFANRTDHVYYRKLAGLLQQGLFNGTHDLANALQQEVTKIREDKRRNCRVKGEKISTALIAPMMLQLCVVMALIMFPAFSNMQF